MLAALDEQPFDLVLMDVQMPEMDGFEATAAIREREQIAGRPPADHRHDGPRHERRPRACLAAGMDGYVSKPIQPRELFETLSPLTPMLPQPVENAPPAAAPASARASTGQHFGAIAAATRPLLREVAAAFLESYPPLLAELQASAASHDAKTLDSRRPHAQEFRRLFWRRGRCAAGRRAGKVGPRHRRPGRLERHRRPGRRARAGDRKPAAGHRRAGRPLISLSREHARSPVFFTMFTIMYKLLIVRGHSSC